jgi:hypothetical protein
MAYLQAETRRSETKCACKLDVLCCLDGTIFIFGEWIYVYSNSFLFFDLRQHFVLCCVRLPPVATSGLQLMDGALHVVAVSRLCPLFAAEPAPLPGRGLECASAHGPAAT